MSENKIRHRAKHRPSLFLLLVVELLRRCFRKEFIDNTNIGTRILHWTADFECFLLSSVAFVGWYDDFSRVWTEVFFDIHCDAVQRMRRRLLPFERTFPLFNQSMEISHRRIINAIVEKMTMTHDQSMPVRFAFVHRLISRRRRVTCPSFVEHVSTTNLASCDIC
jgi:hypothetical protein